LLVIEYVLFRDHVQCEIAWAYPTGYDQCAYLSQSYEIYERIVQGGLRQGLAHGVAMPVPNGMMLHVQGGLLFLLLGPSRLSALTLNFVYYALFQCVLAGTVRWYSGRWSMAWLALGVLLAAGTPFLPQGGLMDFRIDFIAWCLFGIFLSLVVRSGLFASWGWSAAAGAAAGLLVLFRYVSAAYLVGILGSLLLGLCALLYARRRDRPARHDLLIRLGGLASAALLVLLLAAPAVWQKQEAIRSYYLGQLTNGESKVRQQECGVRDTWNRLLFYPRSILAHHAGKPFLLLAGLALAGGAATWLGVSAGRARAAPATPGLAAAAAFVAVCGLVPIGILTLFGSPSPVVGSIVLPALVWLVVLATLGLSRLRDGAVARPAHVWGVAGGGAVALVLGFSVLATGLCHASWLRRYHGADVAEVLRLDDEIARYSRQWGRTAPRLSTNVLWDCMAGIVPVIYERQQVLLGVQRLLPQGVNAVTEEQALAAVRASDFVIMSTLPAVDEPPLPYPFKDSMDEFRPQMLAECEEHFLPLRRFWIRGQEVILYGRPPIDLQGAPEDR